MRCCTSAGLSAINLTKDIPAKVTPVQRSPISPVVRLRKIDSSTSRETLFSQRFSIHDSTDGID
jgi:hypothetical protein